MARLRTFIAVALDAAVHARVTALQETLGRSGAEVKWVEPDNVHVTLLFLGEVDDRAINDVCRAVTECCAEQSGFVTHGSPARVRSGIDSTTAGKVRHGACGLVWGRYAPALCRPVPIHTRSLP